MKATAIPRGLEDIPEPFIRYCVINNASDSDATAETPDLNTGATDTAPVNNKAYMDMLFMLLVVLVFLER